MESRTAMFRQQHNRIVLKWLALIVFLLAFISSIVACGSKGETQDEEQPTAEESQPAPKMREPAPEPEPIRELKPITEPVRELQSINEQQPVEKVEESPISFFEKLVTTKKEPSVPPNVAQDIVNLILDNLLWEEIAFEAPDKVVLEESAPAKLTVNTTVPFERMNEILAAQNKKKKLNLAIVAQLESTLKGDNFEVGNIVPETQSLISPGKMEWQWDVKATKTGKQDLHAMLKVTISTEDEVSASRLIKTFVKTINVTEPKGDPNAKKGSNLWIWIAGIVLLAVASIVAVFMLKPKK